MTEEEKNGVVQEVINTIKGQSQDITELPVSDNIEDFTSLPAVGKDGRLKRFNVKGLRKEFAGSSNVELVQETGQSEDKAMSQKATTAAITAATTTNDGKTLQDVYEVSKTAATRAGQAQTTIEVVQERGEATDKPMSQKAVSDALAQIEKKAEDNATAITSISASGGVPIAQEAGDSTTSVMSQKAVSDAIRGLSDKVRENVDAVKAVSKLEESIVGKEEVVTPYEFTQEKEQKGQIFSLKWTNIGGTYVHFIISVEGYNSIKLLGHSKNVVKIAFLKSIENKRNGEDVLFAGENKLTSISANTEVTLKIPTDAKILFVEGGTIFGRR